jgi:hypothetical protein
MTNKSKDIQMLSAERISVVVTVLNERDGIGPLMESRFWPSAAGSAPDRTIRA